MLVVALTRDSGRMISNMELENTLMQAVQVTKGKTSMITCTVKEHISMEQQVNSVPM